MTKFSYKLHNCQADMIFKITVVFGVFLHLAPASSRGVRLEKDQLYDDFGGGHSGGGGDSAYLLKPGSEPGVVMEDIHHTVDQEKIGGSDKRRKFENGRNNQFQTVNLTVEYVPPANENGTWKVEKKEKTLDLEKEVIKTLTPCQVTTEGLVATAQATVTRALNGLCHSKEMEDRFQDMERSITNQLNTIKTMILNLEDRLGEHEDAVIYGQKQLSAAISKGCSASLNGNGGLGPSITELVNKNQKPSHDYSGSKLTPVTNGNGRLDASVEEVSGTRDPEILKFNSSIHMETSLSGPPRKVFTYYWKIKDMMHKLTGSNSRKSFRSQNFYIFPSGYRMYMRVFHRQNEDYFYVRVGLTKGEFDDSLKWPFPLKHKIHILDQTKEGRTFEDIASRIWDPNLLCSDFNWQKPIKGDNHECVEIGFPHDVLKQREYIRQDALVVKLTVYLES